MVFNQISLDGYFTTENGDISWAHEQAQDAEWSKFAADNASGEATLLFGRKTYEMMASYWPTPKAKADNAGVAEGMNKLQKVVFSRTLEKVSWSNTTLVKSDPAAEVRKMKKESGPDMVIMGSGTIVSLLTQAGLIDEYELVMIPVVLGKGRTMFDGVKEKLKLELTKTRAFKNGSVVMWYDRKA
jgi:dihydrofolate reductase